MSEMAQISSSSEVMVKTEEDVKVAVSESMEDSSSSTKGDTRDENDSISRGEKPDEREPSVPERKEQPTKRSQPKPSPSRKTKNLIPSHSSHPSPQRPYMHENYPPSYPPHNRGPYPPPHPMHGGHRGHPGPYHAPGPGPYYGGGLHDPYRGGPPPHYHQMPSLPHPGQYPPNGHYGHPPNMAGRPGPPPGYHPYGVQSYPPGPPQQMGYHGGPPPHPQSFGHQMNPSHPMTAISDNNSISSSKSKGSHVSRSTKSSHGGSKKRTIEGMHDTKDTHAYSFRRTNSNDSSSSTVSAGNGTSIHPLKQESPRKRERSSSRSSHHLPFSTTDNIFDQERFHRRVPSATSTASSLSAGGFSLHSYDGPRTDAVINDINPMMKASPKRRKASDSAPLVVETGVDNKSKNHRRIPSPTDSALNGARFEQLSMKDKETNRDENNGGTLFMSLSTSPINHPEVDQTPLSKNTNKKGATKITIKTDIMEEDDEGKDSKTEQKPSPFRKPLHNRAADTPAPSVGPDSEMMTDEHLLNRHLRGQTFTPLAHLEQSGISPSNAGFNTIHQTLSWSIAGDTPSLEDLAACSWEEHDKGDSKRPGSTTSHLSTSTREMVISPHNFSLWKDEHETKKGDEGGKDNDTVRLSMLSPHSEIGMIEGESGTTTPLPLFFNDKMGSEERENVNHDRKSSSLRHHMKEEPEHGRNMFGSHGMHPSAMKHHYPNPHYGAPPTPVYAGSKPPTPLYAGSNVGFARSPLHGEGPRMMFGHPPPHAHNDRVRNLRGRVPPGSHMPPMPLHIPPPMSSHHPLTSPMGIGHHGKPMWSPHHGMPPMSSPHHMSPMDMSQSKRKCVPLKPPIPSKFQGDMEKVKGASVPEFTSLVNFPAHMSQKQSVNLPEGLRCCVMCGQACPCSNGVKKKSCPGKGKNDGSLAPRNSNGQDPGNMMGDKGNYAIIPTQNKGLCTLCDVNVWVVVNNGLEIKWCKGCKNFRPWAAFGDKGLATKCLRCRERQREKYAIQKEEKEKSRLTKGAKIKG